jgi:hypothetical protein
MKLRLSMFSFSVLASIISSNARQRDRQEFRIPQLREAEEKAAAHLRIIC